MTVIQVSFLILTLVAPVLAWVFCRRQPDGPAVRHTERTWAAVLVLFYVGDLVMKWRDGTFTLDHALPMHLCDWALISIAISLAWRQRTLFEMAYFWGLAGTLQALFTPALTPGLHWFRVFGFFWIHAGIVIGILHLMLTVRWRPTPRSILHIIVASEIYLATALTINAATGGNYGFLAHKPPTASMLDLFSDTHWLYVVQINLTAFVFFAVLYLPWLIVDLTRRGRGNQEVANA